MGRMMYIFWMDSLSISTSHLSWYAFINRLTPPSKVLRGKLIVAYVVSTFLSACNPNFQFSQKPLILHYHKLAECLPHLLYHIRFNIIVPFTSWSPKWPLTFSVSCPNSLRIFSLSQPLHASLRLFITLIFFVEKLKYEAPHFVHCLASWVNHVACSV
jgi:hypothetical protein